MRVTLFSDLDTLRGFAEDWDRLAAGNPFRSWAWNSAWWEAYGDSTQRDRPRLWTLGVLDDQNRLRGIAPWYRYQSPARGSVVSFLGSGKVCSDYIGIMAAPGDESMVVDRITDFLIDPTGSTPSGMTESDWRELVRWDLLYFDGIDDQDSVMNRFAERIREESSLRFKLRPGLSCWRLELAPTEESLLASKKKSFRKRFRRCRESFLESEDLRVKLPNTIEELAEYTDILIDLHQRRRIFLGEPGCYASSQFEKFQRTVIPALFRRGQATISVLFCKDKPITADYQLLGNGIVYSYQSGLDPDYLKRGPGDIIHGELVHRYVQQGMRAIDFLRGDEAYKEHWQAEPRSTSNWYVAAPHWSARCRDLLRRAGEETKAAIKRRFKHVSTK